MEIAVKTDEAPREMSPTFPPRISAFNGQDDTEAGSLAWGALELDSTPMIGHDAVADAQAQSGPFTNWLGGEERVENP